MTRKDEFEDMNWLLSGHYRIKILEILNSSPSIPSDIAEKINVSRASVSRILKALKEKGMIDSTSSSAKSRLFFITDTGKNALLLVKKLKTHQEE